MQTREIEYPARTSKPPDLVFRTPPNWTYVVFFAGLGALHLTIATLAFLHGRWEAYLSVGLGVIFVGVSLFAYRCRFEMAILPSQRSIRLRSGFGRFRIQRFIPFSRVHGVRLTLTHGVADASSLVEILCENEDLECPPTCIPRQEALCLAMMMGVRLIKVCDDESEMNRCDHIEERN